MTSNRPLRRPIPKLVKRRMRRSSVLAAALLMGVVILDAAAQSGAGTIKGHVRLSGKLPGNPVVRMGVDPKCSQLNAGKRVVDERVAAALDGSLANVFVKLDGTFPSTPVPKAPVLIEQRACVYAPRVIGLRVGQTLQIKNSDTLLHNVHSSSARNPSFNIGQPSTGLVFEYRPKAEETMMKIGCDMHRWMTAFVGVVSHPYFAVSGRGGVFTIDNVPPGIFTIRAWHEVYGLTSRKIVVKPGVITTAEFTYPL